MKMKFIIGSAVASFLLICGSITPEVEISAHEGEVTVAQARPGKHSHKWSKYYNHHNKKEDDTNVEQETTADVETTEQATVGTEATDVQSESGFETLQYNGVAYSLVDYDSFADDVVVPNSEINWKEEYRPGIVYGTGTLFDKGDTVQVFDDNGDIKLELLSILSTDFEFSNGIKIGSSLEEVKAAIGQEDSNETFLRYENDNVRVDFYFTSNVLSNYSVAVKSTLEEYSDDYFYAVRIPKANPFNWTF
ncbi:MAG: hypothetical protein K5769_01835 [Pseudobutyrivibrio sp.]|nr:hypothetical protein [Pseudobutyrivibrio sp.]